MHFISHVSVHFPTLFISSCNYCCCCSGVATRWYIFVSSTNILHLYFKFKGRSLIIYTKNNTGRSTDFVGLHLWLAASDFTPFTLILSALFLRNSSIHFSKIPLIPTLWSLCINLVWGPYGMPWWNRSTQHQRSDFHQACLTNHLSFPVSLSSMIFHIWIHADYCTEYFLP